MLLRGASTCHCKHSRSFARGEPSYLMMIFPSRSPRLSPLAQMSPPCRHCKRLFGIDPHEAHHHCIYLKQLVLLVTFISTSSKVNDPSRMTNPITARIGQGQVVATCYRQGETCEAHVSVCPLPPVSLLPKTHAVTGMQLWTVIQTWRYNERRVIPPDSPAKNLFTLVPFQHILQAFTISSTLEE